MLYVYGSKRWFDIGCQPSGQIDVKELKNTSTRNRTLITYDRELTKEEIYKYELEFIRNS